MYFACAYIHSRHVLSSMHAAAVVGLERTFYQVSESVGVAEVCVIVRNPTIVCPIAFPFTIRFLTADGTAGNFGIYFTNSKAW